jgi:glucose-6-phosphate 1-dehydrogenase
VLKKGTPIYPYAQNTWGPPEVARVTPPGGWDIPVQGTESLSGSG